MKYKNVGPKSITAGLLKDTVALGRANLSVTMPKLAPKPALGTSLEVPPEFDQDPGGRYNVNHVFPQD